MTPWEADNRAILHVDLDAFYASVEVLLDPSLRGKPMAVCGSTEDRHGIILAKTYEAKALGVKTGMTGFEARKLSRNLIVIEPPKFTEYRYFAEKVRAVYQRYSDLVQPYGPDECWLDVTGSLGLFGSAEKIAREIQETIKDEIGLSVSIGVSHNKSIAKLATDMHKPHGITVIKHADLQTIVWSLPVADLIFVGRAIAKKLIASNVNTIGDLARFDPHILHKWFGKNGVKLWALANGDDSSPVTPAGYRDPFKSIGRGITCTSDLENEFEAWRVILELAQDVGRSLREQKVLARGVAIAIRNWSLSVRQFQAQFEGPTRSAYEIAQLAYRLLSTKHGCHIPVRSLAVCAINLIPESAPRQMSVFDILEHREQRDALEGTVYAIKDRYGKMAIKPAVIMGDIKTPGHGKYEVAQPGMMWF